MKPETVILSTSDEAAQPHTMTGWKSRNGYFFADERVARYDGCTHVPCGTCGVPTRKGWTICNGCRQKADIAKWESAPKVEWDGKTPIYSDAMDRYFFDADELQSAIDDEPFGAGDLRLYLCEPQKPHHIEPDDYCQDQLPEDGEVEDADFLAACKALNEAIDKMPPMSWYPTKTAVTVSDPLFQTESTERKS